MTPSQETGVGRQYPFASGLRPTGPTDGSMPRTKPTFTHRTYVFRTRGNTSPTSSHAPPRFDVDLALSVLDQVALIVQPVDKSLYEDYQEAARARVLPRDPDDWPVAGGCAAAQPSNLDRGSGLLWQRHRNLDYGPRRVISSRTPNTQRKPDQASCSSPACHCNPPKATKGLVDEERS